MLTSVDQAPFDARLVIAAVHNEQLADRLDRMGVNVGQTIIRLNEKPAFVPVKVKGPLGEVALGAGMAAKIVVHHDDGHKTPVIEMEPGEKGHVEGLVCGPALEKTLALLGLKVDAEITMVRALPPMEYHILMEGRRIRLAEGAAAKIWGEMGGQSMQFVSSARGKPFIIRELMGGERAQAYLREMGLLPDKTIILENLVPAPYVGREDKEQTVLVAESGLRLYLRLDQARRVMVRPV